MRRRLTLLLIAALLPILLLIIGLAAYSVGQQQAAMKKEAVRSAEQMLERVDAELGTQVALLQSLARSPTLDGEQPNLAGFHEVAARFLQQFPLWTRVILVDRQGMQVVNTARPFGSPLPPVVDEDSYRRVIATRAPVIGNLTGPGALPGDASKVALRVPVFGRDQQVRHALTVTMSPAGLSDLVTRTGASPGWYPLLIDGADRIVAYPFNPQQIGKQAVPQTVAARAAGAEGVYDGMTFDGVRTVAAFKKDTKTGWSAHVSIPEPIYSEPLKRSVVLVSGAGLVGLGSSLLFAWMLRQEVLAGRRNRVMHERTIRMDSLGRMTGGVAHDFNNLLMVILGNLDILQRRLGQSHSCERNLSSIRRAADRGAHLTRELLAFSRGEAKQVEVVDLTERVQAALSMLRQSLPSSIEIETEIVAGLHTVEVDPIQLDLALLNVAVNARDAMPDGGKLRVQIASSTFPDGSGRSGICLSISDTGGGVPAEVLPHVFEPFFTTKEVGKGTGLGLSQVYGFAKTSGGLADITSKIGRGTTVSLYLRAVQAAPVQRVESSTATLVCRPGGIHVMLVDDNDDVRTVTAESLTELGFEVGSYETPAEALSALDCHAARADVVVSDLVMPGELDGLALAIEVRRRWPDIPVVLISGYSTSKDRARQLGFPVVGKPFNAYDLASIIQAQLVAKTPSNVAERRL